MLSLYGEENRCNPADLETITDRGEWPSKLLNRDQHYSEGCIGDTPGSEAKFVIGLHNCEASH